MSKVALVKCESYGYDDVKSAVKKGIDLLGGINRFAKLNEKILLKPNLLMAFSPDKCVTTAPSVFKAVAEIFRSSGAKISYGDSPGFGSPLRVAKKAGLADVAKELNIDLADFKNGKDTSFENGKYIKKFFIANDVLESDAVISIPKLKTHGFQKFTGAVKNQFGCIAGYAKADYHVKLPDANDFARMLVDLDRFIKPRLYIMDGIMAMEGNGPSGGNPKRMNILLFSSDPIALDATVCRLIDLAPEFVPTTKYGQEFGHGTYLEDEITLVGDDINIFRDKTFDIDKNKIQPFVRSRMFSFFSNSFVSKPIINKSICIKCGICINVCPVNPKAVDWKNNIKTKPPVHDYSKCIRCFCCQELCPEHAIVIKKPILRSLFDFF